jgi:hypothetical protein
VQLVARRKSESDKPDRTLDRLVEKVQMFKPDKQTQFVQLARALRDIKDRTGQSIPKVAEMVGMGLRSTYYLIELAERIDEMRIPDHEAEAIGWSKMMILSPVLDRKNYRGWFKAARGVTTVALRGMVRENRLKPEEPAVVTTFFLTREQLRELDGALERRGMRRRGRTYVDRGEALMKLVSAAQAAS